MIGRTISHDHIVEKLGGVGMGGVHKPGRGLRLQLFAD